MKRKRLLSVVMSVMMAFSFNTGNTLADYSIQASADDYEYAWFPVNQVRLTRNCSRSLSGRLACHLILDTQTDPPSR